MARRDVARRDDARWLIEAVERIQNGQDGDGESFRRVYETVHPLFVRFLQRRGLQRPVAEDLAQNAMVRVYKGIGRFGWDSSFNTWTLIIVRNVFNNHLRSLDTARGRAETESVEEYLASWVEGERSRLPSGFAADDPDPEQSARYRELVARLEAEARSLTPRQRQALLFRLQGLSYQEIARLMV